MKVDSSTNPNLPPLAGGVQRGQQGEPAATGNGAAPARSAGGSAADVNLSALASQLHSLAASGSADIDVAHVESIKNAIRQGTLTIDPGKIADGVLETARGLLQANPPAGD
ncbi:MAG TPA: flagellar biosynthesis anti-sigma factor FlgM [Paraburkholderia sp.]